MSVFKKKIISPDFSQDSFVIIDWFLLRTRLPCLSKKNEEGVIRSRKSKKDRQYNDQNRTLNDLQNITQKTKQHEPH